MQLEKSLEDRRESFMEIKEIVNEHPRLSLSKLIDAVKGYNNVSFDIFDTLIKRDVYKEHDVFDLIEKKYNLTHGDKITDFRDLRITAEKLARKNCGREEISLTEIYSSLVLIDQSFDSKIKELILLEEEIECEVSHPNYLLKEAYHYCQSQGKQIYVISDMYLSREFVERILEKNGYIGYKKLFLSSDIGVQKKTGNLYKYVLSSENISKGSIIHIGDNKKSDWISAKRAGFATVNIAKRYIYLKYRSVNNSFDNTTILAFLNNHIASIQNRNIAIGYEVYGPLLYSFVKWLKQNIDPERTILFFSRDCQIVKEAYEIISSNSQNSVYFYGSRKSLLIPALCIDSSIENLCRLLKSESSRFTVRGLLMKIGLNPENYPEILKQYSLSLNSILIRDRLMENNCFVRFYSAIQTEIRNNAEKYFVGFDKYFNSLKCTSDFQVVDIGWRCTMQYCLNNLLNGEYSIHGYYLGVREDAFVDKNMRLGLYMNGEGNIDKKVLLASMTALIEIFFSALHGTVESYDYSGTPILGEHECSNDPDSGQLIRELHEGALQFVKDFKDSILNDLVNVPIESAFDGIKKLGSKPHKEELETFGNFPFRMGVGVVKAAKPGSLFEYMRHPRKFLYDFSNSNWKVAFLKRLFKVDLPYYKIFRLLYEHK